MIFFVFGSDQIEIILMVFFLVYDAMAMEGLELVTHHKALHMRLLSLH